MRGGTSAAHGLCRFFALTREYNWRHSTPNRLLATNKKINAGTELIRCRAHVKFKIDFFKYAMEGTENVTNTLTAITVRIRNAFNT